MKNDFIAIYADIDSEQQREFGNYIRYFYGEKKKIIAIFDETAHLVSSKQDLNLLRKKYSGDDYKTQLNYFSTLKQWLFEFLAVQEVKSNSIEAKFLRLEALRKNGLYDVYKERSEKFMGDLEKNEPLSIWHFFWKIRVAHTDYFHIPIDRLQNYQSDMQLLMQDLDNFYFSAKLLYSAEFSNRSAVSQEAYNPLFLDVILEALDKESDLDAVIKEVYLAIFNLIQYQSKDAYIKLKQFLIDNQQHHKLERLAILQYLLNYSARVLLTNNEDIAMEIFSLYELGIEQSLFTSVGYYNANTIINIVNTACAVGKSDWAKDFIDNNINVILPTEREDTRDVANARILFEKGDFKQVILLAQKVNPQNALLHVNIQLLSLRSHYEISLSVEKINELQFDKLCEMMQTHNSTFYQFARRNKMLSPSQKLNIQNFCKIYNMLIVRKKGKKQLFKELNNNKPMFCYDWIKQKIQQIKH